MIELLDLGGGALVWAALVLLVASYIRGLTGFGFSAVLVAGLSFVIGPAAAVALAVIYEVTASIGQAPGVWKDVDWKPFWSLLGAALLGNPIGVLVLTTASEDVLRIVVFVAILVLTTGLLVGWTSNMAASLPMFFVVGVVAGVVNGATALAGLVIVLAMSFMRVAPLVSTAVAEFCQHRIGIAYIPPGQPWHNGYVESFNNRVRDECLQLNLWSNVIEARIVIGDP